jgi:hypothetical protein
MMMRSTTLLGAANSINDHSSSRTVNIIIGALAALGLLMLLVAIWLWRASRPVPPHLEGLDLITKRRWLQSDVSRRDDLLGHIRHARGAAPPITLAREPEPIEPGPMMPVSLDAASTSLGVASSPGVPIVSASAPSGPAVAVEQSPDRLPPGWVDDAASPAPAGWLDAPAQPVVPPMFERMIVASAVPPPPSGPSATDKGYGDPHE